MLAALLVATSVVLVSFESAAQQPSPGNGSGGPVFNPPHSGPAIGGTSLTLGYIWGPAKMPPPANDFGPGFDYPGTYKLDGAPNHSPYPN
jgi:hypothetical protein